MVLPHREAFGPSAAGAVAMVVRRLAAGPSRYKALVVGPPFQGPGFPGIPFLPARRLAWLPLTQTQQYAAAVAQVLATLPPGLIEVHNKPDVALWLARLFPRRRVSLFLHNDPRTMRGARSPRARLHLLDRLARVVTVSDFLRRALLDGLARAPGRAPLVIHNALDLAEVPAGLPPSEREKVILFVGRVVPDKGPDLFIAACAKTIPVLPGWRAEMIGADGFSAGAPDTGFIRGLRPVAAAAGVVLHGARPHAEVLRAMARAAIVVVPSRWEEPFGLTALEAMACGAVLVCSGRGGLSEVAGDAGLLVDPEDSGGFAQALLRLARDAGLRASLSNAGLQRVRDHFSVVDVIAKLDGLRDGLIGQAMAAGCGTAVRP